MAWQKPKSKRTATEKPDIQVNPNQWRQLDGLHPPQNVRVFKGESQLDDFSINDGFATRTKNLTSTDYPTFKVRNGYTLAGNGGVGGRILGIGVHKDSLLHAISSTGTWYHQALLFGSWATLKSGLSTTATWSFCNFKGNLSDRNLFGANGVDGLHRFDGSAASVVSDAPANLSCIDQHDGRMYGLAGQKLHASALNIATDWTTAKDSFEANLQNSRGETPVGLKAGTGHVLIGFPSSIQELWGNSYRDYRLETITDDCGFVSNQAVVTIQGRIYFVDKHNIYKYSGGLRPSSDFAIPVKPYLDRVTASERHKIACGTDGTKLYISLPLDGQTEPNTVLEYNPEFEGIWYVWKDMTPLFFTNVQTHFIFGDNLGRVLRMGLFTTDNGTAIPWEWVSKPFGSGSLSQQTRWYKLWYVVDLEVGSTMDVYLSASAEGDADWVLVKSISASSEIVSGRVIIPVSTLANNNWKRIRFTGTGPAKMHSFDYQQRDLPMA